jgi:hypothetical protein
MWPFSKVRPKDTLGVYTIRWRKHAHAYGPAKDVPRQLLDLTSDDRSVRERAIDTLFCTIWHQGTVYEATQHAVPFLVKIAACPDVADREHVVHLLACLARGTSYHDVHRKFLTDFDCVPKDMERIVAEELAHVRRCREAVVAGLPTYRALASDPDPAVRIAVGYLLASLECDAGSEIDALADGARTESEPEVAASYILALPAVGADASLLDRLCAEMRGTESDLVQLALALARINVLKEQVEEDAIAVAIQALTSPPVVSRPISEATWFEGRVGNLVTGYLPAIGRERLREYLDELVALLMSAIQRSSPPIRNA